MIQPESSRCSYWCHKYFPWVGETKLGRYALTPITCAEIILSHFKNMWWKCSLTFHFQVWKLLLKEISPSMHFVREVEEFISKSHYRGKFSMSLHHSLFGSCLYFYVLFMFNLLCCKSLIFREYYILQFSPWSLVHWNLISLILSLLHCYNTRPKRLLGI